MGVARNADFSVRARQFRVHDCLDVAVRRPGGRATQELVAENRSVYVIREDLAVRRIDTELTQLSPKKLRF
jgi:hypothetical protein